MKRSLAFFLSSIVLFLGGCAVIGVKVDTKSAEIERRAAMSIVNRNRDSVASHLLAKGYQTTLPQTGRASALINAASLTARAEPGTLEHQVHQSAIRGLLALMSARGFAPLNLVDGRLLKTSKESHTTLDPSTASRILPTDELVITKLKERIIQEGSGLPCIAHFTPESATAMAEPGAPPLGGICEPVTVLLHPDGKNPELVFYRTTNQDTALLNGEKVRLAADFSAPLAYLLSKGPNRALDIRGLLRSDKNITQTGLYQFQRFDPEKIPVVFVHGLLSRPETWVPAVNALLADKKIRARYQFWFFLYPTGLPVWVSAAELRSELDRYRMICDPKRRNPNFERMILVGHSMGGLVSSLQMRTGGEPLWKQFMDTPPHQLSLSPKLKEHIVRIVEFKPRPEVARVVFFSTPHRGSNMAVHPATEFLSRLIRLPVNFLKTDVRMLQSAVRDEFRDLVTTPANSLVFLRANSPLLNSILALPMKQGVPYHSVVGDRGKGDSPHSSDGVVPYWSSHLGGSLSEKIVSSDHGAHQHPEGIEELTRILHLHLISTPH